MTAIAAALWLLGVGISLTYGWRYDHTPGVTRAAPSHWPAASRLPHSAERPTLVMFLHPQCPCSHASLSELSRLLEQHPGAAETHLVFLQPASHPEGWTQTGLWEAAGLLPHAARRLDAEGAEQRRFGARVSGELLVYAADGALLFHGGITGRRGHPSASSGRAAVARILAGSIESSSTSAVFGCELQADCPLPSPGGRSSR